MDYNVAIEGICFKFGHAVTEYDVFRWLRNFDESEWDMALHVLNMVVYYTSDRISETIEREIKELTSNYPDSHIQILPSGNVGKSGHVMAYHAKKIVERLDPKQDYLKLINLKSLDSIPKKSVLVLLDDFSGTGESIKKFYEKKVSDLSIKRKLTCCALTVAFMEKARKFLCDECGIKLYGDCYLPAFAHRGSVFGYEKAMRPIRDFCFKKGEMLLPHWKELDLKPLGYKNSQALVCFEHTTPNNTLPILWYEDVVPGTNIMWNALFPRFANSRIDRGRRLRLSSNFWLSAISHLHLNNTDWTNYHTTESLRMICVVALKYRGRSDLFILQQLGICQDDLDEIVEIGKSKGLFDDNRSLTTEARTIYEEIRKRDHILEYEVKKEIVKSNTDRVYVPKSFRGKF